MSKKGQQAHNGVTFTKPMSPNRDFIPNLIAISTSPRNVILTSQSRIPGQLQWGDMPSRHLTSPRGSLLCLKQSALC